METCRRSHGQAVKILSSQPLSRRAPAVSGRALCCRAKQQVSCKPRLQPTAAGEKPSRAARSQAGAAALLSLGNIGSAVANEFDLLSAPAPTNNYLIDDAGVLNRTTKKGVNDELSKLEKDSGFRLEVATVRKLETESDAFAFGDKLVEKWYETAERGDKKGILLLVTSAKEGALTGGPGFLKAVGDNLIDSVVSENIPILTEEEKFNEAVSSIVKRVEATLTGQKDPGPPTRAVAQTGRTYKTREETSKTRNVTSTIVLVLLGISIVVPMLQYWGYTSKE